MQESGNGQEPEITAFPGWRNQSGARMRVKSDTVAVTQNWKLVLRWKQPELHQARDWMFNRQPQAAAGHCGLTVLEDARCLQQRSLRVQVHGPNESRLGGWAACCRVLCP